MLQAGAEQGINMLVSGLNGTTVKKRRKKKQTNKGKQETGPSALKSLIAD